MFLECSLLTVVNITELAATEIPVSSLCSTQGPVSACFCNPAVLAHDYAIGIPNRR